VRLLLDTHILLWAVGDAPQLPDQARSLIESRSNDVFFSVASLWEIAIKTGLGRPDFQIDVALLYSTLCAADYKELSIKPAHISALSDLAPHHKDPFDRLLIAQANHEGLTVLTHDKALEAYGEVILLV
jgi:PIN domain nuclease of toxin-antitoxin system